MTLTDEQRERIRRNRERALEIRRDRKNKRPPGGEGGASESASKHLKAAGRTEDAPGGTPDPGTGAARRDGKDRAASGSPEPAVVVEEAEVVLEDFEVNAPPTVTRGEAARMYCLPEGTLQVCSYVEKANPHRRGFAPMKLYDRAEIRRRARERYGGLDGLIAERERREQKRFERTLEETKDVFKRK